MACMFGRVEGAKAGPFDGGPSHRIGTAAGTDAGSGNSRFATQVLLNFPYGAAMDNQGNLYIGDADNRRVRRVDSNRIINTFGGTGEAGFSGNGGPTRHNSTDPAESKWTLRVTST